MVRVVLETDIEWFGSLGSCGLGESYKCILGGFEKDFGGFRKVFGNVSEYVGVYSQQSFYRFGSFKVV